jgi:hypothetical protein
MIIPLGFLFFGGCTLWYAVTLHRSRRKVLGWAETPGRITRREVAPSSRGGKTSVSAFRYEALVAYEFTVDGKTFEGDKLYPLGWVTSSRKNREKFLEKIPEKPCIRYDPRNPSDSCLLLPWMGWIVFGYVFGGGLAFLGALILLTRLA